MVRATVAVALFALLCVSSSFAAPLAEEDGTPRDALGCQAAISDIETKIEGLGTQALNIAKLVPQDRIALLQCLLNPTAAATCIQTALQGDGTQVQNAVKQIEQDVQALQKDLSSLVTKCAGAIAGSSASG